tara:strand:+ start:1661 stop:4981 length:3321 start_codon:yes stop_codon:yes gene_type:complete
MCLNHFKALSWGTGFKMRVIDNVNELLGDDLKHELARGGKLKIAAATFSIFAFEALRRELQNVSELEFIFTQPTFVPDQHADKIPKESREFLIPSAQRERDLGGTPFEIHLRNKLTQRAIAKECADWIRSNAVFRSNKTRSPMQQFICSQRPFDTTVYSPLQGFTAVDLGYQRGNAVSNLVQKTTDLAATQTYLRIFDGIWSEPSQVEDVTEKLCQHISEIYAENAPARIYFLMLFSIFNEFLEDINQDLLPNDRTGYQTSVIWNTLYKFQQDAAIGLINKLETYNGCILADSVGLGKTFTALAVIKYYELRNRSVLVLCPKKLSENWLTYNRNLKTNILDKDRLRYDVLCHTDLQRTTGESFGMRLAEVNWGNYDLVVIDESHNFRNNDALKERETRYQKLLNSVVREGVQTKVLMLSATPVNNRFNDLKNQLALAYEGQPEQLTSKLRTDRTVDDIFRQAQTAFNTWSRLPAEDRTPGAILDMLDFDFFELLDSVTIARSRKHIMTHYDTSEIGRFPTRLKPKSHRCGLTNRSDVPDFNDIYSELTLLRLAVYTPLSYVLPSRIAKYEDMYDTDVRDGGGILKQADRETSIRSLMRVNLLKRLESSVEAFRITLGRLAKSHADTLSRIATFEAGGRSGGISSYSDEVDNLDVDFDDVIEPDDLTTGGKIQISFDDMDLPTWKRELEADLQIISALLAEMQKVTPDVDTKLQHIIAELENKFDNPINPGNSKALIFTAFADTALYLNKHISAHVTAKRARHTGCVTGSDAPRSTLKQSYDFQSLLTLFSPKSKKKDLILPNEPAEIDVLVATDCISEGQNLQDCDMVINYDIHWNPVRIIQRFGRVDRIGSTNECIQLVNFWPDISLDEYINLKDRVESRMVIADVTATGDDNPLSAKANDMAYRKEQLRRMQDEVIELEDVRAGISITDLGLNDFRMDLVNHVKANGDLSHVPLGLHAVIPSDEARGLKPGVIFCLRNVKAGAEINRLNRLHPFYLVYVNQDDGVIVQHTDPKRILDLCRTAAKPHTSPIPSLYEPFNRETEDGRKMEAYSALLSDAIKSMIENKQERDIDSLFTPGETTALVGDIKGLDDFELIAFFVVREPS